MEEGIAHVQDHPKRRRRRAATKQGRRGKGPISARLVLDHHLRGDVGLLSEDLIADLFSGLNPEDLSGDRDVRYVAVSPWSPYPSAVEDLPWTIIPVRLQSGNRSKSTSISHSTVHFPAAAGSIQSFVRTLEAADPTRSALSSQNAVEIHILDVNPLCLDTVYVTVERHLLRNLDEVQTKFGGGFSTAAQASNGSWSKGHGSAIVPDRLAKKKTKAYAAEKEERLKKAVREALSDRRILHTGDVLPLPLPSHPITYAPPPPAKISFCEPVAQGLVMPKTKIVLIQTRPQQQPRASKPLPTPGHGALKQVVEDEGDDTSNEQFYSAAEDKPVESSTDMESTSPPDDSDTDASVRSSSDASDDSLEDMISLTAPELPQQPSGTLSAVTSATPRPGGRKFDSHTPGSVISTFTAGTTRPGKGGGKTFKAVGLLDRIPSEILHPKPRDEDDSDSFVYVDIHTLARIGCFSGDWVRIEATEEPQLNMLSSLKFGSLVGLLGDGGQSINWRAARVYGLPGLSSPKPRYPINHSSTRRSSMSQLPPHSLTPTILVPPILLTNLDNPKYLRLSPLPSLSQGSTRSGLAHPKSSMPKSPPVAKEVTLLKISTPLTTDRTLQPALFSGLKRHFESKCRLVKSGDLVGISVDEGLGKTIYSSAKPGEGGGQDDELTVKLGFTPDVHNRGQRSRRKIGVAWFRVGQVVAPQDDMDDKSDGDRWGGVAVIDSSSTRMVQAGSDISLVPGTLKSGWEYWLGVKSLPRSNNDGRRPHAMITEHPKVFVPQVQKRIRELISAATSPRAVQLGMKPVIILLTSTQRSIGKATLARRACSDVGVHTFAVDSYDILAEGGASGGDVKTEAYLKARADRAFTCGANCTALLIQHIEMLTADRMVTAMKEVVADSRVVIATTTEVEKVPEAIRSLFTHELEVTAPDEKEREGILHNVVADQGVKLAADVDLSSVAVKTAALVAGDLVDVVERAVAARTLRLEKLAESAIGPEPEWEVSVRDVQVAGGDSAQCVTKVDFDAAVDAARKNFADAIGAPKIPNVTWDDVGGLTNVKDAVMETIQLPLERPELFAKGMKKRSGILFYGPPGTGKTLLAKAIATEFSLNFFSVKGPELLNMYIGESEANVRRVFQRARDARPCVVFFDELDSVAPKRGNQGDSGGVMDRIVSQLLAELDGMSGGDENGGGVFVIGATNRPDLLDPALLRPGRFDKMLYLGVSDTHEKQVTILEALTRKFTLHPNLSLWRVAEQLPFTYTGADLYALCSDAMLKAITRQANAVDEKIKALPGGPVTTAYFFDHLATPDDVAVMVTEEDFISAKNELVASVSAKELEHFERVRRTFESVDDAKKSASLQTGSKSAHIPRTIGEAINGVGPDGFLDGPEFTTAGNDDNVTSNSNSNGDTSAFSKSTTSANIHKNRHANNRNIGGKSTADKGKGKSKGKASVSVEQYGHSDSSLADDDEDVPNGNGHAYGPPDEDAELRNGPMGDKYIKANEDDDDDDYVIRTDHLVKGDTKQQA